MASTINKKLRRKRAEKISELIKQEEQGSELYCSKYGKDLECDNKTILIDPPNINDNNVSVCKENIYIYIYIYVCTDWFKYVELETFDTFYDDYMEFKRYTLGI